MSKPFPLQPLIDLAKEQSDIAIRRLGELNSKSRDIGEKLNLLVQYKQEYQLRYDESVRNGIHQVEWQNYQRFLNKLDEAIAQQKKLQEEFSQIVEAGRIEYQEKQKRLKSFETLADRHHAAESARSARKEQKELDDFSNKAFMRKTREAD